MNNFKNNRKKPIAAQGAWTPVSFDFLKSAACASLSPLASKLFLDVHAQLSTNAKRNGDICLSPKVMAPRGWSSRATLRATIHELVDARILIQTRQGGRLDCSLFACTLYPLDCDFNKLDVRPGCYRTTDYMADDPKLGDPPTADQPVIWKRPRKKQTVAPSGNKPAKIVPQRYKTSSNRAV